MPKVTNKSALATATTMAAMAMVMATGCSDRECVDKFDCELGAFCSVDGVCTFDESLTIPTNTALYVRTRGGTAAAVVDFEPDGRDTPATLNGSIAGASNEGSARGRLTMMNPGRIDLVVTHPTLSSSFVALFRVPAEVLGEPGDHEIEPPTDLDGPVAQACNYDTTEYDEQIGDVVVHVPEAVAGAPTLPVGIEFHSPQTDAWATIEVPLRW